ncbi:hypothetical protein PINS_up017106 [Pythium insidiosum]|nr:hypothetical protein PINS_up017106 [Pythium insidiosum]
MAASAPPSKADALRVEGRAPLATIDSNRLSTPTALLPRTAVPAPLSGLKRKQRPRESEVPPSPLDHEQQQQRENVAWLDMLLALMERKYQGYCAPTICIQELETAQRLQRHWRWCSDPSYASTHTTTSSSKARRLSHTLQEPSDDLHSTETSEQDPEERRVQMLRRHAQQIADTSVASTTGCGCKTGCLKMYVIHPTCWCVG